MSPDGCLIVLFTVKIAKMTLVKALVKSAEQGALSSGKISSLISSSDISKAGTEVACHNTNRYDHLLYNDTSYLSSGPWWG